AGHPVSGSDLANSLVVEDVVRRGARVAIGHAAANVGEARLVVRSSAVPDDNPEVVEARTRGAVVMKRAELLGVLSTQRRCLAVAGTHGKTTTSSMLAVIL